MCLLIICTAPLLEMLIIAYDLKIFMHCGTSPTLVIGAPNICFTCYLTFIFILFIENDLKNISKKQTNLISIDI